MNLSISKKAKRHALWSAETFWADLGVFQSIKAVCEFYGGKDHWRTYYNDVWKMRNPKSPNYDAEFAYRMSEWTKEHSPNHGISGRTAIVPDNPEWREAYRKALVSGLGNRVAAAKVTPYSFGTLCKMLQEGTSEYDKTLAEAVHLADLELSSYAEEATHSALKSLVEDPTPDQAKVSQAQAVIASKITEKLDRKRWGKELSVTHSGTINHRAIPQGEVINALMDSQRAFFAKPVAALPEPNAELEILEAVIVHPVEAK